MSAEVPSLSINQSENDHFRVNKIDEGSVEEGSCDSNNSNNNSDSDHQSNYAYDEGWVSASSFRDMKFQSEEMKNMLKMERAPTFDKVVQLDYAAAHLFPQWIIENKDWKSTQSKKNDNKISDILQIQYANRSPEQAATLIHWLMSVWQTAYMLGYKRCGQMFKVFHFLTYKPGTDVIVENERGLTFYIVISGTATVHKDGIGVVATISKGQSFGELALTEGNDVRSATVRAHSELELLRLHKVDYDRFVKDIQLAERRENLLVLRDCKIFDNWPRSKIQKMCSTCTRRTFKPGEVIFRQGDTPDCIYFIVDGKISIHKEIVIIVRNRWPTSNNDWDGVAKKRIEPHLVAELVRGNFFGELSIIKNKRRTATATAVTRSVLLCLDKLEFVHLLRSGRAMETVTNYASKYMDDKDILSQKAILKGGPSTTAQLNEYIKSMHEPEKQDRKVCPLKHKKIAPVHSLLASTPRPKTAAARLNNTIVRRIDEDDIEQRFIVDGNMKISTPTRESRRTMRASNIDTSPEGGGGGGGGGGESSSPGYAARHQSLLTSSNNQNNHNNNSSNNLDRRHRGTMANVEANHQPEEEVDELDENFKKMKAKNEDKAVSALADRVKARLDPLKQNKQKQMKESQLQHMMNEIVMANRKLAYLDEMAAVKLNQPAPKKDIASKTDTPARSKKLGFAAGRRKAVSYHRRHSVSDDRRRNSSIISAPGGGPGSGSGGSPTKNIQALGVSAAASAAAAVAATLAMLQQETSSQQYVFAPVAKSPGAKVLKGSNGATPHIDFGDKKIIPMMGAIKSVMLESTTGRAVKSTAAEDIAKYVECSATGNMQAMPVGKRFTRQNTRDLTEWHTQEIVSTSAAVSQNVSASAAKTTEVQKHDAEKSLAKQEVRRNLFLKQGSLRNMSM